MAIDVAGALACLLSEVSISTVLLVYRLRAPCGVLVAESGSKMQQLHPRERLICNFVDTGLLK